MACAVITHPDCLKHEMGARHPECPQRLDAIEEHITAAHLGEHLVRHLAPLATDEQLSRVHPIEYVRAIRDAAPQSGTVHLDPDTAMNPHTLDAALRAAGAAVLATDLVMKNSVSAAFASVRPPGHHACRARPMGFCIFNNVAVAAKHAIAAHGLERVAVIDFDVHHGNGTEDIFEGDPQVLMASTFQHPFYPYSGTEDPASNMFNVPLAAGSGGRDYGDSVLKLTPAPRLSSHERASARIAMRPAHKLKGQILVAPVVVSNTILIAPYTGDNLLEAYNPDGALVWPFNPPK